MPIDYKRYPTNWKTEIVPAVIERAKGKCERCQLVNHSTAFAIKLNVKGDDNKYKIRSLWFRNELDAIRESGCPIEDQEEYVERFVKKVKVVLTVAHLDHDETNHDVSIERLRAWCQLCHLRYDAAEKYRRSLVKQTLFSE